jgi:DNA-directed RNA polymerase subunit RPC12/RpoP
MPEKQEVECPECGTKTVIYDPNSPRWDGTIGGGVCAKCGLEVQKVHERARHERALKKFLEPKKEEKKPDPWW